MRRAFFVYGVVQVGVQYLSQKDGVFWYYRRIPKELQAHYNGKAFFRQSLGTRDAHAAAKKVAALAAEHDALWNSWRSPQGQELGLTSQQNRQAAEALLAAIGLAHGDAHKDEDSGLDHVEVLDGYFEGRYSQKYLKVRHDPQQSQKDVE